MNLLLLKQDDLTSTDHAIVRGRQLSHLHTTLKVSVGDTLTVGIENDVCGTAELIALSAEEAELKLDCNTLPPNPLPLKLVLALPRPKMLRRVVQHAVAMGVKDIALINAWKVEKSYWQSPWLSEESLYENAVLGLEQAKDTMIPRITLHKLFKPFVEDQLPEYAQHTKKLVAHPVSASICPVNETKPITLAIGPEGGFTAYEVDKFEEQGFEKVHIGPRILRVETAVPALISRLFPGV